MSDISKIKVGETTYDIKDQAGREAFANSKVTVLDATSDTDHIPVAKTVYDYGQTIKQYFENSKTSSISSSSSDSQIPTAKAVYDYIQNNSGTGGGGGEGSGESSGSGGTASGYNLADYYAVNTINVVPSMLTEGTPSFDGLYKVSDYNNKDALFHIHGSLEGISFDWTGELVSMQVVSMGELKVPAYAPLFELMFYLFPEDATFTRQTGTDSEGEPIYQEISVSAGIYGIVEDDVTYIITCLEKKDKFLVQKEYQFDTSATPILNVYFKCSDDTDIEGLFTANTVTALNVDGNGIPSVSLDYCAGGHFKPMSYFAPEFNVPTIYALEGALFQGDISAVVVTETTEIPEEFMGTAITLQPGTYLALSDETPYLTLRKLQEKEIIVDLDEKLGAHTATGYSLLELVLGGLEASETGEFDLGLKDTDMEKGNQHAKEISNIFKTALEQRGSVILCLSVSEYVKFIMKTHLIKFGESYTAICSGSLYSDGAWIDVSLQIATFDTDLEVYCKAKALLPTGG